MSAALSPDPRTSLIDCKQLVLFLLVPLVYRFVNGGRPHTLLTVVVTCAAVSAVFGIVQYGILHYDNLGQRPQGTLGHWMTYSGLLMLVIGVAIAQGHLRQERSDLGGAGPAGARRRGGADLHAQRLGRRLRRRSRCCFR